MKETVKTSRTAGYLEKIFRALNERYFDNELEEPIITIQSTPKAYAHVTIGKAWQRGDTTRRVHTHLQYAARHTGLQPERAVSQPKIQSRSRSP